jgi:hypothetical protein
MFEANNLECVVRIASAKTFICSGLSAILAVKLFFPLLQGSNNNWRVLPYVTITRPSILIRCRCPARLEKFEEHSL